MKTLPWIALAVLLTVFVTLRAQSPAPAGAFPRFQMVTGEIVRGSRVPAVFKVDTVTGEAWLYEEGFIPPANNAGQKSLRYGFWQRVDERWLMHDQEEELRQAGMRP